MKTFFFTLAALVVSFSAFANGNKSNACTLLTSNQVVQSNGLQANVFQTGTDRLSLILMQPETQAVQVQLRDSEDNLLYNQTITETGVRQNLNLRQLEKGTYTLTLRSGNECFVRSVVK